MLSLEMRSSAAQLYYGLEYPYHVIVANEVPASFMFASPIGLRTTYTRIRSETN